MLTGPNVSPVSLDGRLAADVGDGAVAFVFTVTNDGSEPADLTFRSGLRAEVVVSEGETEVWRWSDGRLFTQAVETETVGPSGSVRFELRWADPEPGTYTATASLAAADADLTDRVTVEVPRRDRR